MGWNVRSLTTERDFKGYFADVLADNMATADTDRERVASAFDDAATGLDQIIQSASEENNRRRLAREYFQRIEDRNWLEKGWDWIFGQEPPPRLEQNPAPTITTTSSSVDTHDNPPPGTGDNTGVSSAEPGALRDGSSKLSGFCDDLDSPISDVRASMSEYQASCHWGTFDMSGPLQAVDSWVEQTRNDVEWLNTIAAAFEAAGQDGSVTTLNNAALAEALASAGVDVSRSKLDVDPASISGIEPTTGYANGPVNVATGNFVLKQLDFSFSGLASDLTIERTYNSVNHYVGVFGLGWHSRFDERLELSDEKASWYRGDGFEVVFERNGDDFERGTRSDYWLEFGSLANFPALEDVQGSRLLVLKDNQGNRIAFSESGEWVASFASAGWQSFAKRDAQGRLLGVRSSTGRSLTIEYTDSRIAYIQSDSNDRIEYHYDPDGQLVSVTNAAGTRTYEWDDGLITSVTNETGLLEVENKYDKLGRIIWQREPFGREVRFAYLPGRVTSVSDVDGSRANTWVSDAYGRLIRVTDSEGNTQSMTFDKRGHLIQTLERDGSVTVHQYNERGLRTLTVRPEGGTVNYTYDELDRLVSVEDVHGGVLTQTYEGDSYLPSMIKEPLGGEHYLEWSDGKLVSVTDSRGARPKLRYNEFAELVELIDPEGNPWKFDRDNAGRLIGFTSPLGVKRVRLSMLQGVSSHQQTARAKQRRLNGSVTGSSF